MPFKAKKPCRFGGVEYTVDSLIPDEAIDPNQIKRLERSGYIEKQVVAAGDTVPPAPLPSSLLAEEWPAHKDDATIYTEKQLTDMKKDELVELATQAGIAVNENMTKKQIAEAVMALQDEEPSEGDA